MVDDDDDDDDGPYAATTNERCVESSVSPLFTSSSSLPSGPSQLSAAIPEGPIHGYLDCPRMHDARTCHRSQEVYPYSLVKKYSLGTPPPAIVKRLQRIDPTTRLHPLLESSTVSTGFLGQRGST